MACSIWGGSCSLCPWCGEPQCPHYDDNRNEERYWLYALDRKNSNLNVIYKTDDKKEMIEKLKALRDKKFHPNWPKKYQYTYTVDRSKVVRGRYPIAGEEYVPYIELVVSEGDCNWDTDVELIYDMEYGELYYQLDPVLYKVPVKFGKMWDEKLVFKNRYKK